MQWRRCQNEKAPAGTDAFSEFGIFSFEFEKLERRTTTYPAHNQHCSRKSPPCQKRGRNMITKYDVKDLDRDSLPEEVLHELHEYENTGKELIAVSFYNTDDIDEDGHTLEMWELTFYEPFFSFEESDYDTDHFVRVCYSNWPT
jgi:hypothetical protein